MRDKVEVDERGNMQGRVGVAKETGRAAKIVGGV
jgi:hypothetical protein